MIERAPIYGLGWFWRPAEVDRRPVRRWLPETELCPTAGGVAWQPRRCRIVMEPVYLLLPALWVSLCRGMGRDRSIEFRLGVGVRERIDPSEGISRWLLYVRFQWPAPIRQVWAPDRSSAWTGLGWRYTRGCPFHLSVHRA